MTKRINTSSPFLGTNGQPSKTLFRERKSYKDSALTDLDARIQPPVFDVWYDKKGYGKIDLSSNPVILDKSRLKRLSSKDTEVFAVNFVADAFKDFRDFIFVSANKSKISLDSPTFLAIEPRKAYTNFESIYEEYLVAVYNDFNVYFLSEKSRKNKIKNFSDFMGAFEEYISSNARELPISQPGFALSKYCPPHCSGIIIELADDNHGNDIRKFDEYINDINFLYYAQAADKFGFRIDKNAPWRLIADLKSEKMQEYMAKYPQEPEAEPNPGPAPGLPDPTIIFGKYLTKSFEKQISEEVLKDATLTQIIPGAATVEERLRAKFVITDDADLNDPPDIGEPRTTPLARIKGKINFVQLDPILTCFGVPKNVMTIMNGGAGVPPNVPNPLIYFGRNIGDWGIRLNSLGSSTDPDGFPVRYIWNLDEGPLPAYKRSRADFPDEENFVLFPDRGYQKIYKISLRTQYQNGLISEPAFATIKVCGFPWGATTNFAVDGDGNPQDTNISQEDKQWRDLWITQTPGDINDWLMGSNGDREVFFGRQLAATVSPNNPQAIVPVWPEQNRTNSRIKNIAYNNKDNPPGMHGWLTQVKNIPIHPHYKSEAKRGAHGNAPAPNEIFALKLQTDWGPATLPDGTPGPSRRRPGMVRQGGNWQSKVFSGFYGDMLRVSNDTRFQEAETIAEDGSWTTRYSRIRVFAYRGDGRSFEIRQPVPKGLNFTIHKPAVERMTDDQRVFLTRFSRWSSRDYDLYSDENGSYPDSWGNIRVYAPGRYADTGAYFFYVGIAIDRQRFQQYLTTNNLGTLSTNIDDVDPVPNNFLPQRNLPNDGRPPGGVPRSELGPHTHRSVLVQIIKNADYDKHVGIGRTAGLKNNADRAYDNGARPSLISSFDGDLFGQGGCFYPWTPKNNIGERVFSVAGRSESQVRGSEARVDGAGHPDYREWCELDAKRFNERAVSSPIQRNPVYHLYKNWMDGRFQYLIDRFKSVNPPHPQGSGGARTIFENLITAQQARIAAVQRGRARDDRAGGYTYGAHGFSNYAAEGRGRWYRQYRSANTSATSAGAGGGSVVEVGSGTSPPTNTGPKVIIDFDFPKIASTDLSDEEFQLLRREYQKRLQDYPELLELWTLKKDLYDKYLIAYQEWLQKEKLSFDNLFTKYYNGTQINDAAILRKNVISFYNSLALYNPVSSKRVMKCNLEGTAPKITTRNVITEDAVLQTFKEDYWFQLYFSIRVIESGINISKAEHNRIMSIIKNLFNSDPNYARQKASVLVASKTKGILK